MGVLVYGSAANVTGPSGCVKPLRLRARSGFRFYVAANCSEALVSESRTKFVLTYGYTRAKLRQRLVSDLRARQVLFLRLLARLVLWAEAQGFELTMGEGYVGDTDAADKDHDGPHLRTGLHYSRLAMDLNLFVGGVYQNSNGPEFEALGQHWESLDPMCRWGGRFADPNHFSLTWQGKA